MWPCQWAGMTFRIVSVVEHSKCYTSTISVHQNVWKEYLADYKKHISNQMRGYDPMGMKLTSCIALV